ncbi:MAG: metallophosphoesterase [Oscillospiraceae bacterium]|nr:metallophosphoesterase [Oscillospiraceae bacterium]
MIYFTGDTHGDLGRFSQPGMRKLKKGDTLIICGDFGFLWDGSKVEKSILKKLGKKSYNVCFVDGAHENFELLQEYPVAEWNGGKVHQLGGRLFHLMRGQIYTIEGKTIFAMGGGVSPDEEFRSEDENRMHWQIPSREELRAATAALEAVNGQVDYIVTHEPPLRIKAFLQLKQHDSNKDLTGLNTYFEEIGKCCRFERWFFGSMHLDKRIASTHICLFRKIIPANEA